MASDFMLLIPHLSEEFNLIGLPSLPYTVRKMSKSKSKNQSGEETLKILFDSNLMIETLTFASFELVKQIKAFGEDNNTCLDKLHFKNVKLEKQLNMCKLDIKEKIKEVTVAKETSLQLQGRVKYLEKKLKDFSIEQNSLIKKNKTNEDLLKHILRKKELQIRELHKLIWKQYNLANENYFPENFQIIHLNQPNFSHLWSTVKYSNAKTKEECLKEAVCTLQNYNEALMEENFELKIFFYNIFKQFKDTLKIMVNKMHIPNFTILGCKSSDIFDDVERFNMSVYNNILKETFTIITKICDLFEKASFTISGDLFVCWSNIIKGL